jgi:hypothetical protein
MEREKWVERVKREKRVKRVKREKREKREKRAGKTGGLISAMLTEPGFRSRCQERASGSAA